MILSSATSSVISCFARDPMEKPILKTFEKTFFLHEINIQLINPIVAKRTCVLCKLSYIAYVRICF